LSRSASFAVSFAVVGLAAVVPHVVTRLLLVAAPSSEPIASYAAAALLGFIRPSLFGALGAGVGSFTGLAVGWSIYARAPGQVNELHLAAWALFAFLAFATHMTAGFFALRTGVRI
jgi:hypothetical protein